MEANDLTCPPLPISHFNGNVAISSFNTSIGAVVRFTCPSDRDFLSGDPVLQCSTSAQWNGTVPQCLKTDNQTLTKSTAATTTTTGNGSGLNISTSVHATSTTEMTHASTSELGIGTGVLVLWAVGGAMLIALIVLLVCILQSHKKVRRERAAITRAHGTPRHGGVNPSYSSSYDEIWQWIPVINNSRDQCQSQRDSTAQQNSSNAERNLLSTLRLPSYTEAVRHNRQQRASVNNASSPLQSGTTRENQTGGVSVVQMSSDNQYETIPYDTRRHLHNNSQSRQSQQSSHVTSICVRSSLVNPNQHRSSQSAHVIQSRDIPQHDNRGQQRHQGDYDDVSRRTNTSHDTLQIRPITHLGESFGYRDAIYRGILTEVTDNERSSLSLNGDRMRGMSGVIRTSGRDNIAHVTASNSQSVSITRLPRVVPTAPMSSLDSIYF